MVLTKCLTLVEGIRIVAMLKANPFKNCWVGVASNAAVTNKCKYLCYCSETRRSKRVYFEVVCCISCCLFYHEQNYMLHYYFDHHAYDIQYNTNNRFVIIFTCFKNSFSFCFKKCFLCCAIHDWFSF